MKAILLVPAPEWREKLLGDGPCGARVPSMPEPGPCPGFLIPGTGEYTGCDPSRGNDCPACDGTGVRAGLVLAFDNAPVREGRDRAAYVLAEAFDGEAPEHAPAFFHDRLLGWILRTTERSHGVGAMLRWTPVPEGVSPPLRAAHALALCCAARGLGTVVVLP